MRAWRTFRFRVLKSTWGIAIDLRARAVVTSEPPPGLPAAGERTRLDLSKVRLSEADAGQLLAGLRAMAAGIEGAEPSGTIVIEVDLVDYTPTDYQPEGLAAAMIGWAAEEFGLESPVRDVYFDKEHGRYAFVM